VAQPGGVTLGFALRLDGANSRCKFLFWFLGLIMHWMLCIMYVILASCLCCQIPFSVVFTARCYASAVLAMGLCPSVSVCLSVCVCHKPVFY